MKRTTYTGHRTDCISFPLGGIGTGSVGLAGNGRFIDWEIANRPAKGSTLGNSHIAVKAEDENGALIDARVLNGDCHVNYSGQYAVNYGHGMPGATMAGFPHFRGCSFDGRFPIASIDFDDPHFPGKPTLTAFNPFIPRNDRDSGIPAAFFELTIVNTTDRPLTYTAVFALKNPNGNGVNELLDTEALHGIFLGQEGTEDDSLDKFDLTIATPDDGSNDGISRQAAWYRGGWSDALETYWRNFTEKATFPPRSYPSAGGDHCTLAVRKTAGAGESVTFRFVMTWSRPNNYNYWNPLKDESGRDVSWKNYYATLFHDSRDSAAYCMTEWERLRAETFRFRDELFASTLPEEVLEAASATMSVLKTATVLRLENGEFYGWEGLNQNSGSCEGTCTHVWNYAYALCFLFPSLERSIRDTDYRYNIDENGRMQFRMQLPLGRTQSNWRACVDGQMGGIIKSYREWKISGDTDWLRSNWDCIRRSLEYAWSPENFDGWDADCDGVLEGRQHHTLDMELFGPSSWLEGFYLAALRCGAEMADALGEAEAAEKYRSLFEKGRAWSDTNLFNGKWYMQRLDLTDRSILEKYKVCGDALSYWNDEAGEIKYQIGEGSEIDQLLAQWHANILGLGDIFDKRQRQIALRSMYENNFKHDMREFYNPFRLYSVNDESGAVICDYPKGARKPAIPIPYCQETMHGFEYALAGLMISEGMLDEGLEIVRSVRDRYDGEKRDPWNEIECGSNYARSMASFALIPILSGFTFDMTKKHIGFAPLVCRDDFRSIWSLDCAWGNVRLTADRLEINVIDGELPLRTLGIPEGMTAESVTVDGEAVSFTLESNLIRLDDVVVRSSIVVGTRAV